MALFSWGARRRITVISVIVIVLLIITGSIYYTNRKPPSCFDQKQNQDEEGIDCGGENCIPCKNKIQNIVTLWTRLFPTREGVIDIASLVENGNRALRATSLGYVVKVYDSDNVLLVIKEGNTFVGPGERALIFEPELSISNRKPARAVLEIRNVEWIQEEPKPLHIEVIRSDIATVEFPYHVTARIANKGPDPYRSIEMYVVLWAADIVLGVSKTEIAQIDIGEEKDIVFTWPEAITKVTRAEFFFRQQ